jgi:hypothetical protein
MGANLHRFLGSGHQIKEGTPPDTLSLIRIPREENVSRRAWLRMLHMIVQSSQPLLTLKLPRSILYSNCLQQPVHWSHASSLSHESSFALTHNQIALPFSIILMKHCQFKTPR